MIKKGVILAGGNGTRLRPMTLVTNKHLLPVYDKPMIFYPIDNLIKAGIKNILIVTGKEHCGDFVNILGNGSQFGEDIKFTYVVQEEADGIAGALKLAKDFVGDERFIVILGDNIYSGDYLSLAIEENIEGVPSGEGLHIFLKYSDKPDRFGVADFKNRNLVKVVEKPKKFISNQVVTGTYIFDNHLWDILSTLKKSKRGEFEVTDVINQYIKNHSFSWTVLSDNIFWLDAGTIDTLFKSSQYFYLKKNE